MQHKLLVVVAFILLVLTLVRVANAQDGDLANRLKHGSISFALSSGIAYMCRKNIAPTDGSSNQYGCAWMGFAPVFIGTSLFEAFQDDLTDAGSDILVNGLGALGGTLIVNYILPSSWFDKKDVDRVFK